MIVKKCRWVLERSQDAPASSAYFPFPAFLFVCLYLLCFYFCPFFFQALPQHDNGLSLLLSLQFPLPHPSYVSISSGLRARNVTLALRDRAILIGGHHSLSFSLPLFVSFLSFYLFGWVLFIQHSPQPLDSSPLCMPCGVTINIAVVALTLKMGQRPNANKHTLTNKLKEDRNVLLLWSCLFVLYCLWQADQSLQLFKERFSGT